jgi:hypothetical protein
MLTSRAHTLPDTSVRSPYLTVLPGTAGGVMLKP